MSTNGLSIADPETLQRMRSAQMMALQPPPSQAINLPEGQAPTLAIPQPNVSLAQRGTVQGDQYQRQQELQKKPLLESLYSKVSGSQFGQNHPVLGKILGGLAQIPGTAADVALSAGLPRVGEFTPGTSLNHMLKVGQLNKQIATEEGEQEKEAQTGEAKARTEQSEAQTAAMPETARREQEKIDAALAENGLQYDPQSGKITPVPKEQYSPKLQAELLPKNAQEAFIRKNPDASPEQIQNFDQKPISAEQAQALNDTWNAIAEKYHLPTNQFKEGMGSAEASSLASSLNNVIGKGQGETRMNITLRGQDLSNARSERNYTRQDVREHDKAYVQPAETNEKSFEMADQAYREYEALRKQGKNLPTGAQSMLLLSQHLQTTFGTVKGARVTRDMIAHHLGARSIGQDAEVAVNKLINGDTLSPQQWTAFHDLIKQSRDTSWGIAVKEAARKHIPIDFLPKDLETKTGPDGTTYHIEDDGQYHEVGQ